MKEKIKNALKTEYAKMGLSDKAFDGVASFLVKTITKEEEIDGVIKQEDTKNLLKAFQGESDSLRNRAAQLEKDFNAYKESHPDKTDDDDADDDKESKAAKELRDQIAALTARLDKQDKDEKNRATLNAAKEAAKANGCTNAKALSLTERLFSVKDEESQEDASKRFEDEYNKVVKEYFGSSPTPFGGGGSMSDADEKTFHNTLSAFADSKFGKSEGK
jgi:hypothetical protein